MYEEKKYFSNIDWKSLIIKMLILLIIVFVICFIIFKPKNKKNNISLASNISSIKEVAVTYFKNNLTIDEIGESDKVTLEILEAENLIESQKDSKGNSCNSEKSYIYLLKTRDDEYLLKVNMVCGKNEEAKTFNLTSDDLTIIANNEEPVKEEVEEEILVNNEVEEETPVTEVIPEYREEIKNTIADNSVNKETPKTETVKDNKPNVNVEHTNNNSNKVLRYKHIKYSEWTEGNRTGNSIENSTKEVTYYNFCKEDNCVVDRIENMLNYEGYTASFSHKETIMIYRYVYTIWSNSCCIKGFMNTGITEYQ